MQHCDATCAHCARDFFRWWRHRVNAMKARDGKPDFNAAAASSIKPGVTTMNFEAHIAHNLQQIIKALKQAGAPLPREEQVEEIMMSLYDDTFSPSEAAQAMAPDCKNGVSLLMSNEDATVVCFEFHKAHPLWPHTSKTLKTIIFKHRSTRME